MAGNHHHRQRRIALLDLGEQVQPVQLPTVKPDVQQDERVAALRQGGERVDAVSRTSSLIALVFPSAVDHSPDVILIFAAQYITNPTPSMFLYFFSCCLSSS